MPLLFFDLIFGRPARECARAEIPLYQTLSNLSIGNSHKFSINIFPDFVQSANCNLVKNQYNNKCNQELVSHEIHGARTVRK